jgi:hypothetical protein
MKDALRLTQLLSYNSLRIPWGRESSFTIAAVASSLSLSTRDAGVAGCP